MERIRKQIRSARGKGLVSRYWGTPVWPRSVRDYVWQVLLEEGVGVLSGDDVWAMAEMVRRTRGRRGRNAKQGIDPRPVANCQMWDREDG
jgi:hypothetical protein